jgi:hypothetical protein
MRETLSIDELQVEVDYFLDDEPCIECVYVSGVDIYDALKENVIDQLNKDLEAKLEKQHIDMAVSAWMEGI